MNARQTTRRRGSFVTRRRLTVCVLLTAAVGVVLAHEGHAPLPTSGTQVDVDQGHLLLTADARKALGVKTEQVGTEPPADAVLAYVSLVAPWQKHAFATSRLPGRIQGLHVRPGQRVKAGDLLAEVQSTELEQLRLDVLSARTDVRQAEQVLEGLKSSAGVVPGQQVIDAEVALKQSRHSLDVTLAKWQALGLPPAALEATSVPPTLPIRALVSGTAIHSDLSVGKVVEPGEHLFEVVDLSTVWARIGVLEKDVGRVRPGQEVSIRLTAYPRERFGATVQVVSSILDPKTGLNTAWAELKNPAEGEARFLPGMSGEARIRLPVPTGAKAVPSTALVDDGVDRFVLVEVANAEGVSEFQRRSVVVVREGGGAAVIRSSDIYPGDRVVTQGSHELGGLFAPGVVRLSPETVQTIGLTVASVTEAVVEEVVQIPGVAELPPDRRAVASSPLAGTLISVRADRGQEVAHGQVVAEVFSLEFLNLQLELLREELSSGLFEEQVAQLRAAGDGVSRRRIVDVEAQAAASKHRRETLRRRLSILGLTPEQLSALVTKREVVPAVPVRSSIAGRIVSFDRVLGQTVRADEGLFEVHHPSRPWVRGLVSEREVSRVRVGQTARVRPTSDPDVALTATVARSGRTFEEATRSLSVWIELDDHPTIRLRHNQMVRVALTVRAGPPRLAVPLTAVVRDGTRAFVFVQKPDTTFDRRAVSLGRSDDRNVEITSGLAAGELIAVTGSAELQTAYASVR